MGPYILLIVILVILMIISVAIPVKRHLNLLKQTRQDFPELPTHRFVIQDIYTTIKTSNSDDSHDTFVLIEDLDTSEKVLLFMKKTYLIRNDDVYHWEGSTDKEYNLSVWQTKDTIEAHMYELNNIKEKLPITYGKSGGLYKCQEVFGHVEFDDNYFYVYSDDTRKMIYRHPLKDLRNANPIREIQEANNIKVIQSLIHYGGDQL